MAIKSECSWRSQSAGSPTDGDTGYYLKAIDEHLDVTFSNAEITSNSPTVTDDRPVVRMECAYRQRC